MNELLEISRRLYDEFGRGGHWEIVKAEKNENSWNLTIQLIENKDGGAANESNE